MYLDCQLIYKNAYGRISTKLAWGPYCRKGETIHCSITIWCTNLFLCLKPWKFLQQRQQWIKNGRNLKRCRRGTWQKSEVNQRWSMKQGRRAQKFILPHRWTSVIWKMLNWRQKHHKYKGRIVLPRRHCERWLRILCSIRWTRIISISNDGSKRSWMSYSRLPGCSRTSSWRSICLYPGKNGRCSTNYWKYPKSECPDIWIRLPRHKWSNHGPVWKTQSFLLNEICMIILWQDRCGQGNLRKSYWSTVWRRFPIGNAYSYTVKKGYSHLCMWMTSNWLERNKTLIRCGKYSIKKSTWENQHLSLIMYTWDALNDNAK